MERVCVCIKPLHNTVTMTHSASEGAHGAAVVAAAAAGTACQAEQISASHSEAVCQGEVW